MRRRNRTDDLAQSERGYKRFLQSIKRRERKVSSARADYNFLVNARAHSYKNGEIFYFGSRRHDPANSKLKPDLPQIAKLLFKKVQTFTTKRVSWDSNGIILVPAIFSLNKAPNESYSFLKNLLHNIYKGNQIQIKIDYSSCKEIDLDASVCMDILLMEHNLYLKFCKERRYKPAVRSVIPVNYNKPEILKILTAIGAFSNVHGIKLNFADIITYPLSIINKNKQHDSGVDITKMVDYVQGCLERMKKNPLTVEARKKLCDVIGEILINAEEHSTTDYCFSIGMFLEKTDKNCHTGTFNLVIMNFGDTIYEKFNSPSCQQSIVHRMKELSESYTKNKFFGKADFEEETLWTLYSLQEGVTSVPAEKYRKRGNGSIRFIESFFELKGSGTQMDDVSQMTILSGNSKIVFDGRHKIVNVTKEGIPFKIMAFNEKGDINLKPDKKSVTFVDNYFPGTLISARILITDNDIKPNKHEVN